MTIDFDSVPFVRTPDDGTIDAPRRCRSCKAIKEAYPFSYAKCSICGHLYHVVSNTEDVFKTEGMCWCTSLVRSKVIKNVGDYPKFWEECLKNSIGNFFGIGLTCDQCIHKKSCENGGTNTDEMVGACGEFSPKIEFC